MTNHHRMRASVDLLHHELQIWIVTSSRLPWKCSLGVGPRCAPITKLFALSIFPLSTFGRDQLAVDVQIDCAIILLTDDLEPLAVGQVRTASNVGLVLVALCAERDRPVVVVLEGQQSGRGRRVAVLE